MDSIVEEWTPYELFGLPGNGGYNKSTRDTVPHKILKYYWNLIKLDKKYSLKIHQKKLSLIIRTKQTKISWKI